ncbi:hypothetical protein EDD37DRAFT_654113 [Exophiala viscosa]|uniref:uncharacterized protein n=1 Tax=Exophiala viscosa TaxID=2486360 RepID=UPI0021A0582F|nr:hypothetical protein EDD37DRAFT_654113 [Exophiala viscosa]
MAPTESSQRLDAEALFDSVGQAYESAFADCSAQRASVTWLLERLPPQASLAISCCDSQRSRSIIREDRHQRLRAANGKQYDAITVYFSMIASVTQEQIRESIAKIYSWLKPDGLFIFATVPISGENMDIAWMGRPIVASSLSSEEVLEVMKAAKFEVLKVENSKYLPRAAQAGICKEEDVWEEEHLFVYARK